jgi:hypothetical protein
MLPYLLASFRSATNPTDYGLAFILDSVCLGWVLLACHSNQKIPQNASAHPAPPQITHPVPYAMHEKPRSDTHL